MAEIDKLFLAIYSGQTVQCPKGMLLVFVFFFLKRGGRIATFSATSQATFSMFSDITEGS